MLYLLSHILQRGWVIFISLGCISQQLIKTGKLLGRKCWRALWGWDISGSSLILNLDESNPCFPFSPQVKPSIKKLLKGDGVGGSKSFRFEIKAGWTFEERTLSCARGGLDWISGEISPWKGLSSAGIGCPGKQWTPIHGNIQKDVDWGHGLVVDMMVVLGGLKGLFQPYQSHVFVISLNKTKMNLLSKPAEVAAPTPPSPNDL